MLSTLTGRLGSIRAKVSSFIGITDLNTTFMKYEASIVATNEKIENLERNVSIVKNRVFQVDATLNEFMYSAPALSEINMSVKKITEQIVDSLYKQNIVDMSAIRRTVATSVESTLNDFSFRDVIEDLSINCSFADDYGSTITDMSLESERTSALVVDVSSTVNAHSEALDRIEVSLREIRAILNDLHRASGVTPEQQKKMLDVVLPSS